MCECMVKIWNEEGTQTNINKQRVSGIHEYIAFEYSVDADVKSSEQSENDHPESFKRSKQL